MDMIAMEKEVARLRSHNLRLQRRLERSRRDALLYAASLCEDHHMVWAEGEGWGLVATDEHNHGGFAYAAKLREIAK